MIQIDVQRDAQVSLSVQDEQQVDMSVESGAASGGVGTGENGGYYRPSVSSDGVLSWAPSKPNMPSVSTANIKGPPGVDGAQGEPGAPGLDGYTPQKGVDYWTEEDKQEIVDEAAAAVPGADLTGYATEEYVGKKIAEAQLGGEGGGVDLSAYYTKSETDIAIKNAVDAVELLPGPEGPQGETGAAGYTPIKGVDYFDGEDGVPCTHEWEGTVLKVTSASGTSSVDLRGPQGDKGEDGYTPQKGVDYFDGERGPIGETGAEGPQGPAGADGHSPIITIIDGYWHIDGVNTGIGAVGPQGEQGPQGPAYTLTDADKQVIVNGVISALPVYNGEVGE